MGKFILIIISGAIVVIALNVILQSLGMTIPTNQSETRSLTESVVKITEQEIPVLIADTEPERRQGLSGQPTLAPGSGMLFVFDEPGQYPFWMKDMNFPIDIVWIDEQGLITEITPNVSPNTYPTLFTPKDPILFVLELPAGTVNKYGIKKDNVVMWRK